LEDHKREQRQAAWKINDEAQDIPAARASMNEIADNVGDFRPHLFYRRS
jgi:hypothetical protein